MIEYRPFLNTDPPRLVTLWHACRLGRGAADGFSVDGFETFNFAQTYFDPRGLIVATEGDRLVGFVHAGFGADESGRKLCREQGVICAVMVHPEHRRRGVGRELVSRAVGYLDKSGSRAIYAGPAPPRDPFYVGLYGGSEPAGFLDSDPASAPFFEALGYEPVERHIIYQRDTQARDPVSLRLVSIRRKTELVVADHPDDMPWWWATRYGRLDSLRFLLVTKGDQVPVATATVVGLDLYTNKWRERAVGLTDLYVADDRRRQGYGQALVLEVCRRMREELVTKVEAHAAESNTAGIALLESTGMEQIDAGTVFRRSGDA